MYVGQLITFMQRHGSSLSRVYCIFPISTNLAIPKDNLKCHCNEKIVALILIVTEQHLQIKLNGVFCLSISCLVSEIFRFLKHAN